MKTDNPNLRRRAEEFLDRNPEAVSTIPAGDLHQLIEDLHIHQIELEMQNEELRRAQLALEAARNEYSDLYDFAPVGYFTVSEKGMIAAVNLTGAAMLGVERQRLIGNSFSHFVHREDQDLYYFHNKALLEEMSQKSFELKLMGKEGCTFYAHLECAPVEPGGGRAPQIRVAVSDITEQEEIKGQLRQALKMDSIGTLSGGIAHDFNNILSVIVGNTELAMEEVPEKSRVHANLTGIRDACLRASRIVKQLLNFSRKTGQKPSKITAILKESLQFLRSAIPTTIEIRTNMTATHDVVLADPVQINEILLNLCINASHAMERTGGVLEITVENAILGRRPDSNKALACSWCIS